MSEIRDPSREEFTEASSDALFGGGSDENTGRHVQVVVMMIGTSVRDLIARAAGPIHREWRYRPR